MGITLLGIWMILTGLFLRWLYNNLESIQEQIRKAKSEEWKNVIHQEDDYWDGENLDGKANPYGRPATRNRYDLERADSGSVERFHHGGW